MQTIVFYSYKGGVGRSLCLTQLAVMLARIGKSVFALDMDLESPSLVYKFDLVNKTPKFSYGFVDYTWDFLCTGKFPNLAAKVIYIPMGTAPGRIVFFPAGKAFDPDSKYWQKLFKQRVQRLFWGNTEESRDYFLGLRKRIAEDLEPDFLLIDSRSGISVYSGIATRLLAKDDTVAYFAPNNKEGEEAASAFLKSLVGWRANQNSEAPKKIVVAFTRIPEYYAHNDARPGQIKFLADEEREIRIAELQLLLHHVGKEFREKDIVLISSVPSIELKEELPIGLEGNPKPWRIIKDYVDFFSAIIPDLRFKFNEFSVDIPTYRPFMLISEKGKMINPEDSSRNVSFRVDTLEATFDAIFKDAYSKHLEKSLARLKRGSGSKAAARRSAVKDAQKSASETIYRAGYEAATRFCNYLKDMWAKEGERRRLALPAREKLDQWCEFDSTVGFGMFEARTWGEGYEGEILLKDNFLIYQRTADAPNLCPYMTGYICHVLDTVFPDATVKVTHNREDCGQFAKKKEATCVFRFSASPKRKPMGRRAY